MVCIWVLLAYAALQAQLTAAYEYESDYEVFPKFRRIEAKLREFEARIQKIEKGPSTTVAFAAYTSSTPLKFAHTFQDIVFNAVYFNFGHCYSSSDGYFTAPSRGLYVFSWTILVPPGKVFDTQIQVNGTQQVLSNCNNNGGQAYDTCSNTTPLMLRKGDRVNIRKRHGTEMFGSQFCTFKGWKLY